MFWATGILGVLLFIAPWVLRYNVEPNAFWTSIILGAIIVIVSVIKGVARDVNPWEYWVAGIAGILAVIAPFVLGFTASAMAMWSNVILGGLVFLLCLYQVFGRRPVRAI